MPATLGGVPLIGELSVVRALAALELREAGVRSG